MSQIATRYAESLLLIAKENNKIDSYKEDIKTIEESFSLANIKPFFISSRISKQEKKDVINSVLKDKTDKYILYFLYVLIDKNRIDHYDDIFKEFIHLCNEELNIKEGIIETPRPLNKELIKKLENTLSKDGKKIELYEKINKSLISGFKITIDNHVIDNSLKNKINDLENTLLRKDGNLWN